MICVVSGSSRTLKTGKDGGKEETPEDLGGFG